MAIKTLYTAVGRFERRTNGCNRSCPIILLGGQEYMADMQEMVIWSMLNWRILRWDDIAQEYEKLATASGYCTERSWEDCTNRLLTRGLLVSGSGETEYDALYDLLGSLSIIPTSGPFFLRLASFVKLTLLAHVPVSAARKLFQKDKRTKYEALVMRLAGQALLSTAEIIKCIDKNISRLPNECALLDSLYGDETTTSDNIASMVKVSQSSKPVTLAVMIKHRQCFFYKQIIRLYALANCSLEKFAASDSVFFWEITAPRRITDNHIKLFLKSFKICVAYNNPGADIHSRHFRCHKRNVDSRQKDTYGVNILSIKVGIVYSLCAKAQQEVACTTAWITNCFCS